MNVVYVTGNKNKAKYFSKLLGIDIEHHPADVVEIQSLDAEEVVVAKAKEAYVQLAKPVIVEDTSLELKSMGRLPGTFIKWFLEEIGTEGLCRLADNDPQRLAHASATFVYYDGKKAKIFKGGLDGTIAKEPRGNTDFGWNPIFIPEGKQQTLGEMNEQEFEAAYTKVKPFAELKKYLNSVNIRTIT